MGIKHMKMGGADGGRGGSLLIAQILIFILKNPILSGFFFSILRGMRKSFRLSRTSSLFHVFFLVIPYNFIF
jgi:hypothetical protein